MFTQQSRSLPLQNQLSGSLPQGWVLPPSLNLMYLYSNRFSGTLPVDVELPPSLQILNL